MCRVSVWNGRRFCDEWDRKSAFPGLLLAWGDRFQFTCSTSLPLSAAYYGWRLFLSPFLVLACFLAPFGSRWVLFCHYSACVLLEARWLVACRLLLYGLVPVRCPCMAAGGGLRRDAVALLALVPVLIEKFCEGLLALLLVGGVAVAVVAYPGVVESYVREAVG